MVNNFFYYIYSHRFKRYLIRLFVVNFLPIFYLLDTTSFDYGFFSIQCAQLGCESVLGIDADELRIERAKFAAEVFELKNVRFETTDIYQREMSKDRFDIVLALGILHRIPDIYGFLDRISGIGDILILEFKTLRSFFPVCRFGGAQQKGNEYNKLYFLPSVKFVTEILSSLGFTDFEFYKDKSKLKYKRTILVSSKNKPIS